MVFSVPSKRSPRYYHFFKLQANIWLPILEVLPHVLIHISPRAPLQVERSTSVISLLEFSNFPLEFHWTKPEYETEGMFTLILYRKSSAVASPELTDLEKRIVEVMSADIKPSIDDLCPSAATRL